MSRAIRPSQQTLVPNAVHTLLPLPMATIASLHRIGGGGQQLVIKKRQGFFPMRRENLFYGVANPPKPFHPVAQLPQLAQAVCVQQRRSNNA